jgi:hypothetical protein
MFQPKSLFLAAGLQCCKQTSFFDKDQAREFFSEYLPPSRCSDVVSAMDWSTNIRRELMHQIRIKSQRYRVRESRLNCDKKFHCSNNDHVFQVVIGGCRHKVYLSVERCSVTREKIARGHWWQQGDRQLYEHRFILSVPEV